MRGTELLFRSVIPIGVLLTCDDDAALARRSPANETNFRFSFSLSLSLSLFSLLSSEALSSSNTHRDLKSRSGDFFSLFSSLFSFSFLDVFFFFHYPPGARSRHGNLRATKADLQRKCWPLKETRKNHNFLLHQ